MNTFHKTDLLSSETEYLGSLAERDSAQSTRVYPSAELRESALSSTAFDVSEVASERIGSKTGTEKFEDTVIADDNSEWFKEKVEEKKKELLQLREEAEKKNRAMVSSEASEVNIFEESVATSIHDGNYRHPYFFVVKEITPRELKMLLNTFQ